MSKNLNKTVYVISGPTAVGKSIIALYLAKRIGGEIVNCDSIQLYKYMDIGSAKPSEKDMQTVPHHLYGIVEPDFNMTVAKYQELAMNTIDEIISRGKIPIVCGGTGLYLNSILYDMDFAAKPNDNGERRKELEEMAERLGSEYMHEILSAIDAESAKRIHPNNVRKVVRAIEAYEFGSRIEDLDECGPREGYNFKFFGITMDREWLYNRINKRVIELVRGGLIDEVKQLEEMGYTEELPSMKGIGYKEIFAYLHGEVELKETIMAIMKNTRHYAKRQLTWLKRYDGDIHWIEIMKNRSVGDVVDEILATE